MNRLTMLAVPMLALASLLAWEITTPEGSDELAVLVPIHPRAGAVASKAVGPEATIMMDAARIVLARPLFSPGRQPPAPEAEPATEVHADAFPRLSGVIVGPPGRRAIFVDGAGKAHVASEGTTIGKFTVRSIEPGQVILTSSEGERVLHPSFPKAELAGKSADAHSPPVTPPTDGQRP